MPAVHGTRLRAECPRRPCRTVRRAGADHANAARTRTTDSCGGNLLYVPRRQSHRSTGVFPYIFRCNTRCPPCSSRICRKSAEISASLTAKGCFRLFDFQLRCFNNGIRRKFAEFTLEPILPKHSRKFCPVAHPCSRDPTPRLPGGHPPRIARR